MGFRLEASAPGSSFWSGNAAAIGTVADVVTVNSDGAADHVVSLGNVGPGGRAGINLGGGVFPAIFSLSATNDAALNCAFQAGEVVWGRYAKAGQAGVGNLGPANASGLALDTDTILYRAAANVFTTTGLFRWQAANEQVTVGAAGAAAVLPAAPTKYLKVQMDDGTVLVVPAYLAA